MIKFLAPAFVLLASNAVPETVGCRFTERPASWSASRAVPAYAGTQPLTRMRIDLCAYVEWRLAYENLTLLPGMHCDFTGMAIRLEASFDPTFETDVIDTIVPTSDVSFAGTAFDGTVDFGGGSGVVHEFDQTHFESIVENVVNPGQFQSTYRLYVRATPLSSLRIRGIGAYIALADPIAAVGVSVTYNP